MTVAASIPARMKKELERLAKERGMSVRKLAGSFIVKGLLEARRSPELEKVLLMRHEVRVREKVLSLLRSPVPAPSEQDEILRELLGEIHELEREGADVEDLRRLVEALVMKYTLVHPAVFQSEPGHFLVVQGPGGEAVAKALLRTGKLVFTAWHGLRAWVMLKLLAMTYPFREDMGLEEAARVVEERAKKAGLKVSVRPLKAEEQKIYASGPILVLPRLEEREQE